LYLKITNYSAAGASQQGALQHLVLSAQHFALSALQQTAALSLQHLSQHFFSPHFPQQLIAANATATIRSIFFIIQ